MSITVEELTNKLKEKNIRLSHQRIKVLEYMIDNKTHPTVDQIYTDLHREIPTLSKTTIYNTLHTLIDADLVKVINIEDNELRYDGNVNNHGHFKCESCGKIYDFDIDFDSCITKGLGNFTVTEKDVYFKGICPICNNIKVNK